MKRILMGLGAAAAMFAVPAVANAYTAYTTADLNLRACGSTRCQAIAVIPRGAPVNVLGGSGGWNYVTYAGIAGYASASYITTGYARARPPVVGYPPVVIGYPMFPAPTYGYYQKPWWDAQHGAWYDGRRWFFGGRWYASPSFSFSFSFGG